MDACSCGKEVNGSMAGASRKTKRNAEQGEQGRTLRERRARGRALVIFYITAFSAVVIGAILLCIFVFFKVGEVKVTGGASYRQEDILRVCNISEGDNLVLLSTGDREAELERRFPYIEKARIVKHIPSTIEIEITEAQTAFSIESEQGYLYVSRSGKVLEIAASPCPDSTVVRGSAPTQAGLSQQIAYEEQSTQKLLQKINSQVEKYNIENITEIDLSNLYDVTMTYDDRIVFSFGNTNDIEYKTLFGIKTLLQLQEDGSLTEETRGTIDLSVVADGNKSYFLEDIGNGVTASDEGVAGREPDAGSSDSSEDHAGDTGDGGAYE